MIGGTWGWVPASLLSLGALAVGGSNDQRAVPLRAPLESAVPAQMVGSTGRDIPISKAEQRVAGMSRYLMRVYEPAARAGGSLPFSLYVGYYESQTQGKTIHSPKNCLPGAGWEALTATVSPVQTASGTVQVNRYLLQNGDERALVLYWYQGRGRIEANEYAVKWDLLRDAAFRGRSDEALVRIIVPIKGDVEDAFQQATSVAQEVIPAVYRSLPV